MRSTIDKVIGLIKYSKIIQIGIMFILIALSLAIINSEELSFFGITIQQYWNDSIPQGK